MAKDAKNVEGLIGHKFALASATAAALTLPLAFATPSVAIQRAEKAVDGAQSKAKGAITRAPSQQDFNRLKNEYETQKQNYIKDLANYNNTVNSPDTKTKSDYDDLVSDQNDEIDDLNQELNDLRDNLNDLNQMVKDIDTSNKEALDASIAEYRRHADAAEAAKAKMENLEQQIAATRTPETQNINELKAKAEAAKQEMDQKAAALNAAKPAFDQNTAEYNTKKAQYEAKLNGIDTQIDALKAQIQALTKDSPAGYQDARDEASRIQAQIDALKAEHDAIEAEYNQIKASYNGVKAKQTELENAYNAAKAAVDAANAKVNEVNNQITSDNSQLQNEYNKAKAEYDQAIAARNATEALINKQKQDAMTENAKNLQAYNEAKAKYDEVAAKVKQFNRERTNTAKAIKDSKAKVNGAYEAAKAAYTKLGKALNAAKAELRDYNNDIDAYNSGQEALYNAEMQTYRRLQNEYIEAKRKFDNELDDMRRYSHLNGHLSQAQGQALQWGHHPVDVNNLSNRGDLYWEGNPHTVTDSNELYTRLAPGQSKTVVYTGEAIRGSKFAGKDINAVRVTYTNKNNYDEWIGANADITHGFVVVFDYKDASKQNPIGKKRLFSFDNPNMPKHFSERYQHSQQNTGVSIQLIDDNGRPFEFSNDKPAGLWIASLNHNQEEGGTVDGAEVLTQWNFNKLIPITGSKATATDRVPYINHNVIGTTQYTNGGNTQPGNVFSKLNNGWDHTGSPDFYKAAILGVKTSGNTIDFTTTQNVAVVKPNDPRYKKFGRANGMGTWFAFYSDTQIAPIPLVPGVPERPELHTKNKIDYEFSMPDKPDAKPSMEVPSVQKIKNPDKVTKVAEVKTPTADLGIAPTAPKAPTTENPIDVVAPAAKPGDLNLPGLVDAPKPLPVVPKVPKYQVPMTPIKPIPPATAKEITVNVGEEITPDMIKNQIETTGDIAKVEPVKGKIDTSKPGKQTVEVKVTYTDGSSVITPMDVNVLLPWTPIKPIAPATADPIRVKVGTEITPDMVKNQIKTDGDVAKVELVDGPIDTSYVHPVKVTYKDGSSVVTPMKVTVWTPWTPIKPIPPAKAKEITVNVGEEITPDMIKPKIETTGEIAKVEPVNGKIDTSKPGKQTVDVKVTYPDGSSVITPMEVNVVQPWTPIKPIAPAVADPIRVKVGTEITPDMVKNHVAKVELVDGPIDTSYVHTEKVPVKVTYKDGSSVVTPMKVTVWAPMTPIKPFHLQQPNL